MGGAERMATPSSSCLETQPWRPSLISSQPWRPSLISSQPCLLKGVFRDDGYEVLVWDSCSMWRERMKIEDINQRMRSLNPNVEAPLSLVISHLSSLLLSSHTTFNEIISTSKEEKHLVINGTLSTLPFTWQFNCTHTPENMIHIHLVGPFITSINALTQQKQELVSIIKRKDREIQDYKDSGSIVSRRYLETESFDENTFTSVMTTSQVFEDIVRNSTDILVNKLYQELYHNVAMTTMWLKEDQQTMIGDNTPTPPLPQSQANKQPLTSSPAKDEELDKREALVRKLEENKIRGKKKKKRLM